MDITEIKIRKTLGGTKRKAVASITLDGQFAIHDISVIQLEGKPAFVKVPGTKVGNLRFLAQILYILHKTNRHMY